MVVFSVCIGVGGCVCPISSRACCAGMDYLKLMKSAPSSASSTDDMTALITLYIVNTAPFLGDNTVLFNMKKFPSALLMDFSREV